MSDNQYTRIRLVDEEREPLETIRHANQGLNERVQRAWMLLLTDENRPDGGFRDAAIASLLGVSQRTVERVRQRGVEEALEAVLERQQPGTDNRPNWMGGEVRREGHWLVRYHRKGAPNGR